MTIETPKQSIEEQVWRIPGRGARLLVDLDGIENNVAAIAANVSPSARVMAVVKAGGYGHGGSLVAKAAIAGGATWLGVATVSEGKALRQAGIAAPIMVLGPSMPAEAPAAHAHRLHITIGSAHQSEAILREAAAFASVRPLGVHLKIDTGMNRYGVNRSEAVHVARTIADSEALSLDGVFTHFASADDMQADFTRQQAVVFTQSLVELDQAGVKPALVHASNSAALFRFREFDFDLVRPGIGIYGVRPGPGVELFPGMRPVLKVTATVQRMECLQPGDAVGYGGTFVATESVKVGLLSFGYADGYPRSLSNRSWVGFRGARLPVLGRVSMDQTSIGVGAHIRAGVSAVVAVAGDGSDGEPTIEEIATMAGTIPYEILTGLGLRLPGYYHRSGAIVAYDNI
ncbi:N/A [soil metagenome]